jgi:hypothetical protein
MSEIRALIRLAKTVREPRQALMLLIAAVVGIAIVYLIPGDILEQNK